jgi:UPF0755 protein
VNRPPVRGDAGWQPGDPSDPSEAGTAPPAGPPPDDERYEYDDELDDDERYDDEPLPGEYEVLRDESSRGRRVLTVLVGIFALGVLALAIAGLWLRAQLDPGGAPGAEIQLTIPTGSAVGDIAELLEANDVVPNATAFRYYLRFKGEDAFQAGNFTFQQHSAAWEALEVLRAGPQAPPFQQFTVPEGFTVAQIAAKIASDLPSFSADAVAEKLATGQVRPASLPPEVSSLEGFLFPDTYRIEEGQDELAALQAMAAQFDAVAGELGLADAQARVGVSPYQAVIVASLIQEEAGTVEEMPRIARVIYNRLDEGIPLGVDAALCYGLNKSCTDLTRSDLESDNPYNTRVVVGLPPTPIAAPGRDALAAALAPAEGPWLYYVRDPDTSRTPAGGHFFTDDYDEFLAVKRQCEAAGLGCG